MEEDKEWISVGVWADFNLGSKYSSDRIRLFTVDSFHVGEFLSDKEETFISLNQNGCDYL